MAKTEKFDYDSQLKIDFGEGKSVVVKTLLDSVVVYIVDGEQKLEEVIEL